MIIGKTNFPRQKISDAEKEADDKKWYRECVDSCFNAIFVTEREKHRKMQVWEDLDNDIVDQSEIEQVFNPMGLESGVFPVGLRHYPTVRQKIDVLQGEELNREFRYTVRSTNPSKNAKILDDKVDKVIDFAVNFLTQQFMSKNGVKDISQLSQEEQKALDARLQEFLKETQEFYDIEYKEFSEIIGEKLLKYVFRDQDMLIKFNRGFRDAMVKKQQVYRLDNINDSLQITKCDPKGVFFLDRYDPYILERCGRIIEITYEPINKVIDDFYDELTPEQIDQLESYTMYSTGNQNNVLQYQAKLPPIYSMANGNMLPISDLNNNVGFLTEYNSYGNVRIIRARWIGRREVKLIYKIDENGDGYEEVADIKYKINEELGEKVIKRFWINEAYQSTKIGNDIYVKMQPLEFQIRKINNKSQCHLGYVGTEFPSGMYEKTESFQYLYDIYMNRLELLMAKYKGPIYELDIAKIPQDWDMDKWMYYAEVLGWAPIDNFAEVRKGVATGQIAGQFNTTGKVLNADPGNLFTQVTNFLMYIEKVISDVTGVTDQRLGQVQNRETLGGIERSITQSSYSTEAYFALHEDTKRRVMMAALDYSKMIYAKSNNKKSLFLFSDEERSFLEFNAEDIASEDHDIFVNNTRNDAEVRNVLMQMAQSYAQTDRSLGLLVDCLNDSNPTSIAKKLLAHEKLQQQQAAEQSQAEQQAQQQLNETVEAGKERDREIKIYDIDKNYEIEMAKLNIATTPTDNTKEIELKEREVKVKEADQKLKEVAEKNNNANKKRELEIKDKQVKVKANGSK